MNIKYIVLILIFFSFNLLAGQHTALDNAIQRMSEIIANENSLFDKWSSSYIIMHKRLHGPDAFMSNFEYIEGTVNKNKAALMYKIFDKRDKSTGIYLIKMVTSVP